MAGPQPERTYEVSLAGTFSPARLAAFCALGVQRAETTSTFRLTVPDDGDVREIVDRLRRLGYELLTIRPCAPPVHPQSSPLGDAPDVPARDRASTQSLEKESEPGMQATDVHGPIDFVLLEFPGDRLTGRAAEELLALEERGIVRLYDVMVLGKTAEGDVFTLDLAEESGARLGGFETLAWAMTGLLTDEDRELAAEALAPGTLAALIVYENLWAVPFVAAARESGGELVAGTRIPAQDVMDALEVLEAAETLETTS